MIKAVLKMSLCFGLIFYLIEVECFADEGSGSANDPYLLPQTTLVFGSMTNTVRMSNSYGSATSNFNSNNFNVGGFDLEVNALKFMNIGAFFRVQSLKTPNGDQFVNQDFTVLLGAFSRFFYSPAFLRSKYFIPAVFARVDLGAGPILLDNSAGIALQTGAHFGIETYFGKWFGLSVSYGQLFEFGRHTITDADVTYSNSGQILLVGLKTTFF